MASEYNLRALESLVSKTLFGRAPWPSQELIVSKTYHLRSRGSRISLKE